MSAIHQVTTDRTGLVRRAYDAWSFYGVDRLERFLSDQVVLEDPPDLPDARLTQGSTEVRRRLDEVLQCVGGWIEIRDVEELNESILVAMLWKADTEDGCEIDIAELFHVVEVAGGKVSRIRVFLDRESATEALSARKS